MKHIHLVTSEVIFLINGRIPIPDHLLTLCCKQPVSDIRKAGGKVTKYSDICTCGPLRKETAALRAKGKSS